MIDTFGFGRTVMDGKERTCDVLFSRQGYDGWCGEEGHSPAIEHTESVMREEPDIIIACTEVDGRMKASDKIRKYIQTVQESRFDCRENQEGFHLHNDTSKHAKAVAALHLTC